MCHGRRFGELVASWGILWRPIKKDISCTGTIIEALCKLHNYCKSWDPRFGERTMVATDTVNYGDHDGVGRSTPFFADDFPYDQDIAERLQAEAYQPRGAIPQHARREALAQHCADRPGGEGLFRPPHNYRTR